MQIIKNNIRKCDINKNINYKQKAREAIIVDLTSNLIIKV